MFNESRPSASKFHAADGIFLAAAIVVCSLCAFVGIALPLGSFPGDTFFLLGNAYRVAHGQIPHVDFSSPWGPVIFLIEAAGLHLSGMRPSGLGYANAVFGPLIGLWTFCIARARWSPVVACIVGVYSLLLIAAPFPLGNNPVDFSYAMVYNRYGYALLGIVLLECTADMLTAKGLVRQNAMLAVSTGVALGLLALLKISFEIVALSFVVILPAVGSAGGTRRLALVGTSFAFVLLLGLVYLQFDVGDIARDLAMAANSRAMSLQVSSLLAVFSISNAALLVIGTFVARVRGAFVAVLTIAVGCVVLLTNQQVGGFPLNAYAALALVATCVPNAERFSAWPFGITFMAAICVLPVYEESTISLVSAAFARSEPVRAGVSVLRMPERGTSLTFAAFRGQESSKPDIVRYTVVLDDGLTLLRKNLKGNEGVLSFEEFNAFNYILNLPPPRGGFAAAAYDYIFDDVAHPSPKRFFGSAPYVLVPKYGKTEAGGGTSEEIDTAALVHLYGPTLRAKFAVVAETRHWVLWRRL